MVLAELVDGIAIDSSMLAVGKYAVSVSWLLLLQLIRCLSPQPEAPHTTREKSICYDQRLQSSGF